MWKANERKIPRKIHRKNGISWLLIRNGVGLDRRKIVLKIDGKIYSENYISILCSHLVQDFGDEEVLQHDGASCQASRLTKRFLVDEDVEHLVICPAQSPDPNIILPLWLKLKKKKQMLKRNPRYLQELLDDCHKN